jgi:hypothetical protein
MSIKDFYKDIKSKSTAVKNNELSKLYARPVKERAEVRVRLPNRRLLTIEEREAILKQ